MGRLDVENPRISEILTGVEASIDTDAEVHGIAYRSDRVTPGDAFFCIPGFAHDGHDFAADAAARGAAVIVAERRTDATAPHVITPDTRVALAHGSSAFHGRPSESLDIVGITGTNGKTTTTYLLDSILRAAGRTTGIIGTVETRVAGERRQASRTTPESADLQALFAEMRDAGVDSVAMEVSSHAIDLHRVDAVRFAVAAFTNLTQDHLDYHHTVEEYFAVKRRLFTQFDVGSRVVDIDTAAGRELAEEIGGCLTVGNSTGAAVRATDIKLNPTSSEFVLTVPGGAANVTLPLAGHFNVSNALIAAGSAIALGIALDDVVAGLSSAPQVPGRLERVDAGQPFTVFVDYAHTPDALEKAIAAVRAVTPGEVIVVFGCGGDRDPDKRPVMGSAVARSADHAVLTSDNPRSEDPVGIVLQVEDGLKGGEATYEVEIDRRMAIACALGRAGAGDAVLIAGKGHEDYQIFADRTIHFDDREVAREELERLC